MKRLITVGRDNRHSQHDTPTTCHPEGNGKGSIMKNRFVFAQRGIVLWVVGALVGASLVLAPSVFANHSVLVEGEQDFDGDGRLGSDEDTDGDGIFGSINTGLADANNNGRVTIVTSGRFVETVFITAANGITILEAAPGVTAVVEAVMPGDTNNASRESMPGIVVSSNGDFPVEIRNMVVRNWTVGIQVLGGSRVTIDACKIDSNVNFGIQVADTASVVINDTEVNSSGFRQSGALGVVAANPGIGISYEGSSQGAITLTTVAHSAAAGISRTTGGEVRLLGNTVFGNNPDLVGFPSP